jgi:hypothetical protein
MRYKAVDRELWILENLKCIMGSENRPEIFLPNLEIKKHDIYFCYIEYANNKNVYSTLQFMLQC